MYASLQDNILSILNLHREAHVSYDSMMHIIKLYYSEGGGIIISLSAYKLSTHSEQSENVLL